MTEQEAQKDIERTLLLCFLLNQGDREGYRQSVMIAAENALPEDYRQDFVDLALKAWDQTMAAEKEEET